MTKVFISMPMRGRTDENIKKSFDKTEKLAKVIFDDDVVIVNPFKPRKKRSEKIPMRHDVQALSESISLLSLADYAIFVNDYYVYNGCEIEHNVCSDYKIPYMMFQAEFICPDIVEMREQEKNNYIPAPVHPELPE